MAEPLTLVIEGDGDFEALTLAWLMSPYETETELAHAMVVAIGTDSRAQEGDILPGFDDTDLAGWWGDLMARELFDGWDVGCRLWLLRRAKILPPGASEGDTVERVEAYLNEAGQPFVDAKIGQRCIATARRVSDERIDAVMTLHRGSAREIELRYQILWQDVR